MGRVEAGALGRTATNTVTNQETGSGKLGSNADNRVEQEVGVAKQGRRRQRQESVRTRKKLARWEIAE